jgi:hypothetical protein
MCTFFVNVDSVYVTVIIEFVSFTRFMELLAEEFLLHAVHSFLGIIINFYFYMLFVSPIYSFAEMFLRSRIFVCTLNYFSMC